MALSIKNPRTEKLARELSEQTGETLTEAVTSALEERIARLESRRVPDLERDRIQSLLDGLRALPDLDDRSADEILDYDEHGLP